MFYVLTALRAELRSRGWFDQTGREPPNMADSLDLVALGTIADVVPLDRNNRVLVAGGLARIRAGRARPGIEALLEVAGRDGRTISSGDLGFILGPRLNAAGRLDDMSVGIECLLAESHAAARPLAQQLHELNRERRDIEADMQEEAQAQMSALALEPAAMPFGLCVYQPSFHQGVVGIVASRLREQYHRPTIVFADAGDGELKGSGRSIEGVHIRDVLDSIAASHPTLIDKFGGHAMAAGLTLPAARLGEFETAFNETVAAVLSGVPPEPILETDGELGASELALETAELLERAGPWGQHFPEPIFEGVFRILEQRLLKERHLKLQLGHEDQRLEGIAFNVDLEEWPDPGADKVGLVYQLAVNDFRGERRAQLVIRQLWKC
jgi:single-stranded-DNA-specific exonuclease